MDPSQELTLTMRPASAARRAGSAAWATSSGPTVFTRTIPRKGSAVRPAMLMVPSASG